MRANSKVAILVVSMFLLAALAPAVTVLCDKDSAAAVTAGEESIPQGVSSSEATIFTEKTANYSGLVYLSDEFPIGTTQNISDWAYSNAPGYGYWVNINENSTDYGKVLTYGYFSMSEEQIRQDIVDRYYRDNVIDEKGEKYVAVGSTIRIGNSNLTYSCTPGGDIRIETGALTIKAIYDKLGRSLAVPASYDSFVMDYDGVLTVYDVSTPVVESAYWVVLEDTATKSTYTVMRNVDQANAKFQFLQTTFITESACNVSLHITKASAADVTTNITADMNFADCYFSGLQYAKIYVIDTINGDIRPVQIGGTYNVDVKDVTNGVTQPKTVTLSGHSNYIYGTVVDCEGSKPVGTSVVTKPLYGAAVAYTVIRESGETYSGTSKVSSITDETGDVEGFFMIEAEYGSKVQIIDVVCVGYSFPDFETYSIAKVTGDLSTMDTNCVFTALEKTLTVTVRDQTGAVAPSCLLTAEWWYEYGGTVSRDYPGTDFPGSLPSTSFTTNSNGVATVSFSEPTGAGISYILVVRAEKPVGVAEDRIVYTFDTDDTSSWTTLSSLPTSLTYEGNVILVASSGPTSSLIKAKEYSFTVTMTSANARALEGAGIVANWYYRGKDAGSTNKTSVPFELDKTNESKGKVNTVVNYTDSLGVLRVVYAVPVFYDTNWSLNVSSAFIYIYGTEYNFSYLDITSLTVDPDVSAYPGCVRLQYYNSPIPPNPIDVPPANIFSGSNCDLTADDSIYIISGTVVAYTGTVPYMVRMVATFVESGSIEKVFYRSGTTITYSFEMIGGKTPNIEMFSDGYTFTSISPSVGTVDHDLTVNFVSTYNTVTVYREPAVPIGITTGYVVSTVEEGDIIRYFYQLGTDTTLHSTMVKASSTSVMFIVKGSAGMNVRMTASDTDGKYYVGEFDELGNATTVKLKETRNVTYKVTTDTVLTGYPIAVYYKGEKINEFDGVATVKIPDDEANVTYRYDSYPIEKTVLSGGKYDGFYGFDLDGYVSKNVERLITVTIEYYATSSMNNLSGATCKRIVYVDDLNPTTAVLSVGAQKTFIAPDLEGFTFAGWYLDGQYYSDSDKKACSFTAVGTMSDDVTLRAYYSADSAAQADNSVDSTVVIIGIIAVVVAVLALAYVVFQSKRF